MEFWFRKDECRGVDVKMKVVSIKGKSPHFCERSSQKGFCVIQYLSGLAVVEDKVSSLEER